MLSCGIDFGTSNSLAAVARRGGEVVVSAVDPANADPQLLPSLLYFSRRGWHRVGRAATHAYQQDPDGRFIRALKGALPEHGPEDTFRVFKASYTLPGLARLLFARLKEQLEVACGEEVGAATVGRPVRFALDPAADRRAEVMLREAAEGAGFRSVRFLTEPEAATRYYFASAGLAPGATVLVFDFGGGTLDLCLAQFRREGYHVLSTGGAAIGGTLLDRIVFERKLLRHLGQGRKWGPGLDLPHSIFNRLVNPDANWRISEHEYAASVRTLLRASAASGTDSPELRQFHAVASRRLGPDLFAAIEAAKVRLSAVEQTEIRYEAEGVRIVEPLARAELWELFHDELAAIRRLIQETLAAGNRRPEQVDRVLLAGGSSALVCTQELLRGIFGPERVPLRQDLFTSIVRGLALTAAHRAEERAEEPAAALAAR
jgi:hypothetical chaperone protein